MPLFRAVAFCAVLLSLSALAEEKTFSGTIMEKRDNAPAAALAMLKEKKTKGEEQRVWNLYASGALAKAITRFSKDKTKAVLKGVEVDGGIQVSGISEPEVIKADDPKVEAVKSEAKTEAKSESKKESGGFSDILERAKAAVEGAGGAKSIGDAVLSNDEVRAGLREALSKGIKAAIAELGRLDGYLKNADVHIPVPDDLQKVEEGMRLIKQDKKVDEFIQSMNRAAEQAVPDVIDIFADAIASMTIDDAKGILKGEKDAATQYFKKTSETKLIERISPIVKKATDNVGVTATYKKLMSKAGPLTQFLNKDDLDIDAYVTRKGLDGLFFMIAKEEKDIRENPAARTTDVLRKIFGSIEKK